MVTAKDLANPYWRLNNLYKIKDKRGREVPFKMNWAQDYIYKNLWYLDLVLKARQLGITTFYQLFMLDRCIFNSNINAGVIAHNRDDAQKFFKDKIKFAYDKLPEELKKRVGAKNDSANELTFSNGSSIRVGTSLRSGTYQYLHVSEFGKICARYPDKAEEIKTGALNTVAAGQFVLIESTAEGDYGDFYDLCMEYKNYPGELTPLDYKFFFFDWMSHPEYKLSKEDAKKVIIHPDLDAYFENLQIETGIKLSHEQKAWYAKKKVTQKNKMKQEYPSTPAEAFEQISEFAVYGEEIGKVMEEGRLCSLPFNKSKPTCLFFDIGKSTKAATTAAWFLQDNDPWFDWVDYYQESLKPVGVYVRDIRSKGYNIDKWYIPHDGGDQKDYEIKTFKSRLIDAGVPEDDIVVVKKVDYVKTGIDITKEKFPSFRFNKDSKPLMDQGWKALKAYRYSWDPKKSTMGDVIHDWASHPSDAIRQFGQGYQGPASNDDKIELDMPEGNWMGA